MCSVEIFQPAEGNKPTFCPYLYFCSFLCSSDVFCPLTSEKALFFLSKELCTLRSLIFLGEDETFVQSSGCVCEEHPAGEMIHNPDSLQKIPPLQAANAITLVRLFVYFIFFSHSLCVCRSSAAVFASHAMK